MHIIFLIRKFKRPMPIGLSVVRLESVMENILVISEVQIIYGAPLLDINLFVPQLDHRDNAKSGWLSNPHLDMVKGESGKHRPE